MAGCVNLDPGYKCNPCPSGYYDFNFYENKRRKLFPLSQLCRPITGIVPDKSLCDSKAECEIIDSTQVIFLVSFFFFWNN